jgi:hypothetical protein
MTALRDVSGTLSVAIAGPVVRDGGITPEREQMQG